MTKTFEEKSQSEEWEAWKFVSEMLDNPTHGIFLTSKCYEQIHDFVVEQKEKASLTMYEKGRKEAIKQVEEKISRLVIYTGGSSVNEKDRRVNLAAVKEILSAEIKK